MIQVFLGTGLNGYMKIAEIQTPAKPSSPEKAKIKSMQQGIDTQKLAVAQERERQRNLKQADQMRKLQQKIVSKIPSLLT